MAIGSISAALLASASLRNQTQNGFPTNSRPLPATTRNGAGQPSSGIRVRALTIDARVDTWTNSITAIHPQPAPTTPEPAHVNSATESPRGGTKEQQDLHVLVSAVHAMFRMNGKEFDGEALEQNAAATMASAGQAQASPIDQLAVSQLVVQQTSVHDNTAAKAQPPQQDPLALDLDGNGFHVSSAADGVNFDLLGNGTAVQTPTLTDGDAWLALDRNGNGQIDSGLELFGNFRGHADGFGDLAEYDSNQDRRG